MTHPLPRILARALPALLLLLSACGAPGSYRRPDTAPPAAYRPQLGVADSAASAARLPYGDFFADSTLVGLIDRAVAGNLDLQSALKQVEIARAELGSARLGRLPTLAGQLGATRSYRSDNSLAALGGTDRRVDDFTASAAASWELDLWNKAGSRRKSAFAAWLASREAARAVETRLVATVADSYYSLLALDEGLRISRRSLALADTTLTMMHLRYQAGEVTSLAVSQQEGARQAIAARIPELERASSAAETALAALAGRMPEPTRRGKPLNALQAATAIPTGIPAALLENRPDVKAAEQELRRAWADTKVARAALYPSLTLTAEGGLNAFRSSDWFSTPGSLFGALGGSLVQPLFQQGRLRADYSKAELRRQQAVLSFREAMLTAVGEVTDALTAIRKLHEEEMAARRRTESLRKGASDAALLFRAGMASWLEVITAEQGALQAELDLVETRRRRLTAAADLYRALGGGWQRGEAEGGR